MKSIVRRRLALLATGAACGSVFLTVSAPARAQGTLSKYVYPLAAAMESAYEAQAATDDGLVRREIAAAS